MILEIIKEPKETIAFGKLRWGQVFRVNATYYIKYVTEGKMCKAINLSTFIGDQIDDCTLVIPVKGTLTIGE